MSRTVDTKGGNRVEGVLEADRIAESHLDVRVGRRGDGAAVFE